MSDHPVAKAVGALTAAIGLLTGIGTIVGWIDSGSLSDTLFDAIQIAGLAYLIVSGFACAVALVLARNVNWFVRALGILFSAFGAVSVSYWGAWEGEDPGFFFVWGCIGIVAGVVVAVLWVHGAAQSYRDSHMTCPDCAETVKSEARVCRYCGFRFKPPLSSTVSEELSIPLA